MHSRRCIDYRGHIVDLDDHGIERILGSRLGRGENDCDGLADIADLLVRKDRLLVGFEFGRCFLPQRDGGNRCAKIGGGNDGVDPGARHGGAFVD